MQEEVENRTLTLVVNGTKFTGRLFKAAITKYLAHRKEKKLNKQRSRDAPVKPQGKQTVKQLIGQNQGVSNIEITDPSIKEFEKIARKYGVDYAVKKDRSTSPPKYLIFFKGRDADAPDRRFHRIHRQKGEKSRENRASVCAGKAEPVQRAGQKCRGGPHQAKGAGTMKKQLDIKKLLILNLPYILMGLFATNFGEAWRMAQGADASAKGALPNFCLAGGAGKLVAQPTPVGPVGGNLLRWWSAAGGISEKQKCEEIPPRHGVWFRPLECIILSVKEAYMDAQEVMHMTDYSKITALYSRLSVGDEDRDGGESNSIQNQKIFLENYAKEQHLTNIRHYIDDDESGRFFDRSAYSRMMDDVENGKIGVCIMKDLTRWGRDYLQVGNAMEIFRRNNVRFIAVNNGIDSENPDTLEFAPFINIMSEWYAKDISKKVKTGIKTKGMSESRLPPKPPMAMSNPRTTRIFGLSTRKPPELFV